MQIILDYPWWFLLFCCFLGASISAILYYRVNHFTDDSKNFIWIKRGLAFFRFLAITILAFLLLSPYIKSKFIDKIEPVIVFLHDNSESVKLGFNKIDSLSYIQATNEMLEKLSEKYQIDYFTFDNQVKRTDTLSFDGKSTDIAQALNDINGLYFNTNVGAVIMPSDGIFNEGINPLYTEFSFPLYTIALGDTTPQRDLKISAVRNNKIAYLDDKVNVEIDIEAFKLKGEKYQLEVLQIIAGGKEVSISKQNFIISEEYEEKNTAVVVPANAPGMLRFKTVVSNLDNEVTYQNNYREFYIDIIDSRQKILMIANAPHPDIGAIKSVVEKNKNYEWEVQYIQNYNANVEKYNLVILHQLPSQNFRANQIFAELKARRIPIWIITGNATNFSQFNAEQNIVNIVVNNNSKNDASAFYNTNFSVFNINENTAVKLKRFPPLSVPFGNFDLKAGAKAMLYQKIGAVETDFPILAFGQNLGVKNAVFVGDGLWRWRLYDYLDNKNHEAFEEIVQKTINYLAVKADKRKFKVNLPKNIFEESEPLVIEAELYNDAYELVNEPEANILIKDENDKEFPFVFSKVNNAYNLKTSALPVGDYTFKASTNYNGKLQEVEGKFSIQALQREALQTQANHQLLYQLAEKFNGAFYYPENLNQLTENILSEESIRPLLFESYKTRPLVNLFWIFFLIVSLLSIEWFARKYFGGY